MFVENKYKKWYYMIIENAKNRNLEGYKEKHHIIPKCMGGNDNIENLVELTAREHFICHWLLTKFVNTTFYQKKMLNALGKFVQKNSKQKRNLTSKQYEIARKAISDANAGRLYSEEIRKKISEKNKGRAPWNKGLTGFQECTQEKKTLLSNLYKGKTFEDRFGNKAKQIKEKMSESKKGHSAGMLGKQHSPETRKKMSESMKGKRGPQQRIDFCPTCNALDVTARHVKFCNAGKVDWKKKK